MSVDRFKWIRIEGFRSIKDLTLEPAGLQVLIGENGAGKSTIIEALEILRLAATEHHFTTEFYSRHGSLRELKNSDSERLRLSLELTGEPALRYSIALGSGANSPLPTIVEESLNVVDGPTIVDRTSSSTRVSTEREGADVFASPKRLLEKVEVSPESSVVVSYWGYRAPPEAARVRKAVREIRVHTPFDTRPSWADKSATPSMRAPTQLQAASHLERGGRNLASVFHELRNRGRQVWDSVMADVRKGLGQDVSDVVIPAKEASGFFELALRLEGRRDVIHGSQLSAGQLSYLGLVALRHIEHDFSLLLFDEPEMHLHPQLLVRATWLFEELSEKGPVIVATQADSMLDALTSDVDSVRVLSLNEKRETELHRLSRERLARWKAEYGTIGTLRREGLIPDLVERPA
jgi:predicted ATPase